MKLKKKEKNEFLNKLLEYKTTAKSENKNSEQDKLDESDSLLFDDKINFYEVQKKNIINYMTPIKVNNTKNENEEEEDNEEEEEESDENEEGESLNGKESGTKSNQSSLNMPDNNIQRKKSENKSEKKVKRKNRI